jgi:uncharacterized repeat protein (TIGR03803 family)
VYELDSSGDEIMLYSFPSTIDGSSPDGVIRDSEGNLYGTTFEGDPENRGVVYKLDSAGHETLLHSFTGGSDGGDPNASIIRDADGNLYGTTFFGGANGDGVIFKLGPSGDQTVLYNFTGGLDGNLPDSGVIRDTAGNLYGTTELGGANGVGVVYKLDPNSNETVLYNFTNGLDGGYPVGSLTPCPNGNLYGATASGGEFNDGVIFEINNGRFKVVHSFTGGAGGNNPNPPLVCDSSNNLYGAAFSGGAGSGLVFKLDAAGKYTVLYALAGGAAGGSPNPPIIGAEGSLYFTTAAGGPANAGLLIQLSTARQATVLYTFPGGAGGSVPDSWLVRDPAGNFYGTTLYGGKLNGGIVFVLKP